MKNRFALLVLLLTVSACSGMSKKTATTMGEVAPENVALPRSISQAVDGPLRTPQNRERDKYRHPKETLAFFGVKPEMTVVEISPSNGWYTEILAPLLAAKGQYVAAVPPMQGKEYLMKRHEDLKAWLARYSNVGPTVKIADFDTTTGQDIVAPGTADMVLTFRNVHNWMKDGKDQKAFDLFFSALKPGGILGVVEHRAAMNSSVADSIKTGYVTEKHVIELAKRAGFRYVDKSEVNANPKDTKNHPEGVWTLPPVLRLGEKDREKYLAIGESDRMTLRFQKPLK